MENSITITGAGSGLGKSLAETLGKSGGSSLRIVGGRREDQLKTVGASVGATEVIPGNLFQEGSLPYNTMMRCYGKVIAHVAAINLDTHPVESEREPLRLAQNAFLERLIEQLKKNDPQNNRLFVDINSVTSFFARESVRAQGYPYMLMKMQQADILTQARKDLKSAGVELLVAYPGAIRTEMMSHLPDDAKAVQMANLFGKRLKNVPGRSEGLVQDRIFQPDEVAASLAMAINYFLVNGDIPDNTREWIMANSADLHVQWGTPEKRAGMSCT